jgi:hypothetical protein
MAGRWGRAYDEGTLHYFLATERKRAAGRGHAVLLLLVEREAETGARAPLGAPVARRLFATLCQSLRDTDIVGWYREGLVAAALLTEAREGPRTDPRQVVRERVQAALIARFSSDVAARLRVWVQEDPPSDHFESSPRDERAADDSGRVRCSTSA